MKPYLLGIALTAALAMGVQAAEPIWDGNQVHMVSEKLGDGVFAFYADNASELNHHGGAAATSGGLIVGSKGALLIDSMLNQRLNAQVQAMSAQLGNKPLLYAVNTSAHGDHSYGNMYLPASTLVIQHAQTREFVEQHLADDKAFMIGHFGAGRGIEEIKARTGDLLVPAGGALEIDLGGKTVVVRDFGFAQTGGDLWVWDPQAKVLWSGNPVIAGKPALPWLLDGHLVATLETLQRVYDFLPDDARIVPGHGVPLRKADLKWHIDYLATVRTQVQSAIDQGLTLEQTVQRVTMPQFAGYVLFAWVHPGLNVPAAYRDLSGGAAARP
ncbi:MBL fold metallo-hydrolase [Chitinimonas sp.]|uniref:MBL fold metallo-hydrolase n=1 Tax=Chitinimonas sp. TaxID=1934313 RepID=UPI0035AFB119